MMFVWTSLLYILIRYVFIQECGKPKDDEWRKWLASFCPLMQVRTARHSQSVLSWSTERVSVVVMLRWPLLPVDGIGCSSCMVYSFPSSARHYRKTEKMAKLRHYHPLFFLGQIQKGFGSIIIFEYRNIFEFLTYIRAYKWLNQKK